MDEDIYKGVFFLIYFDNIVYNKNNEWIGLFINNIVDN